MAEDIISRLSTCTPYGLEDYTVLSDAIAEIKRLHAVNKSLQRQLLDTYINHPRILELEKEKDMWERMSRNH